MQRRNVLREQCSDGQRNDHYGEREYRRNVAAGPE
jgi:hypothetical protein